MIETFDAILPHGITLNCRATGRRGAPVLVFLHGFPEAAFVWDEVVGRPVDVLVDGKLFAMIAFAKANNFASIKLEPLRIGDDSGTLTIEFRPRVFTVPKDVDPSIEDPRALGVALHRLRIRSVT